jgi:predicted regulator of Ras-like GTPase activity (Roadblock/LC7/MglB family)
MPNQHDELECQAILDRLVSSSEALTALLITKEGHAVAHAGDTSYLDTTAVAALVAGMFSATREVARLVNEQQFSILLQQGENRHIHISLVTEAVLMVVVFEDYQRIGRVRLEARKSGQAMQSVLATPGRPQEQIATQEFREVALNLIDKIFAPRR